MASNFAAWNTSLATPLEVKPASIGTPGKNEILVKNHAIAINPIDGKLQYAALYPMSYPTILGLDVAGEVITVGPDVTRFKPGDRVAGCAVGHSTKRNEERAFQVYTILQTNMVAEIPHTMSFEDAVVMGLGVSTAADGLFNPDLLNLQLPTEPVRPSTGKTLLVWGGSSSVGSNAIQLAAAAGFEVITTTSPKNFEFVKKLGASQCFDYSSPTVVMDVLAAFKDKLSAGAFDAIGGDIAWTPILDIVKQTEGIKFVATVISGFLDPPEGVTMKKVLATSCKDNHVGKAIWENFLPAALKAGSFVPAPRPLIAGHGLENLQAAVDLQRKGVSARKVVVLL
jgi:NADPH:quinone reductase-like Zn-dependent oxidoreductase